MTFRLPPKASTQRSNTNHKNNTQTEKIAAFSHTQYILSHTHTSISAICLRRLKLGLESKKLHNSLIKRSSTDRPHLKPRIGVLTFNSSDKNCRENDLKVITSVTKMSVCQ